MTSPEICPSGFICNEVGLAIPVVLCPAGFFCLEGTSVLDTTLSAQQIDDGIRSELQHHLVETTDGDIVDSALLPTYREVTNTELDNNITFLPLCPQACDSKTFCLGGVAHRNTIEWLPSQPEGAQAPQECTEGTFCVVGTSTSTAQKCFEGHYCPPGVDYPLQAPLGSFTGLEGSISPTLCFPGTYAPLKATAECRACPAGYSCKGYGTYIPEICDKATFRSIGNTVTCKMCPGGMWSPFDGLEDASLCEPCPPGRVCGVSGMKALHESSPCPSGHACSDMTDKSKQFSNPCPAGHVCDMGTALQDQYALQCDSGHICERGTSFLLRMRSRCQMGYFCPAATPMLAKEIQCPKATTTDAGASESSQCKIASVRVCDKIDNEYGPAFYYPAPFTYNQNGKTITTQDEVQILKHVDVVDTENSTQFWHNDTVVVYRACPQTGWERGGQTITVIGKNFRNSPDLRCLFWRDWDEWRYEVPATFINSQYIQCESPPFPWWECDPRVLKGESVAKCLANDPRDHEGVSKQEQKYQDMINGVTTTAVIDGVDTIVPTVVRHGKTRAYVTVSNGARFAGEVVHKLSSGSETDLGYSAELSSSIEVDSPNSRLDARYSASFDYDYTYNDRCAADQTRSGCSESEDEMILLTQCSTRRSSEIPRHYEKGWFLLPGMSEAHIMMDLSHIPISLEYGNHFRIAMYVAPSVCEETQCDRSSRTEIKYNPLKNGPRNYLEVLPCQRPLPMPKWFSSLENEHIHDKMNFTVLALEDLLLKVEIHIVHGSYISSYRLFENTTQVNTRSPTRSHFTFGGPDHVHVEKRRLACVRSSSTLHGEFSQCVSPEEIEIPKNYFFTAYYTRDNYENFQPPLNLPPRYKDLEKGRVLINFNISQERTLDLPLILDTPDEIAVDTAHYWTGQKAMGHRMAAKQDKIKYRETFDVISEGDGDEGEKLDSEADMVLPYLPYFSNCFGFDSYIPISTLWESEMCELPPPSEIELESGDVAVAYPRNWWRREYPALVQFDDTVKMNPYAVFAMFWELEAPPAVPLADWCTFQIQCAYEENVGQKAIKSRWFEADNDDELFSMFAYPITLEEYFQGVDTMERMMTVDYSEDYMIPVVVDRLAADDPVKTPFLCMAGDLCFPRSVTFEVMYYQETEKIKRIISATLVYEDFDKDITRTDYSLNVVLQPLNWIELLIKFAFDTDIYLYMFVMIGTLTVLITVILWAIARLVTRLANPPPFRFFQYMRLVAPPAISGFWLASAPIIVVQILIQCMLRLDDQLAFMGIAVKGSNTINWESFWLFDDQFGNLPFDHIKRHYMDDAPVSDDEHKLLDRGPVRLGRVGISLLILGTYLMMNGAVIFLPKRVSKREREIELKRNKEAAEKQEIWHPTHWKRAKFLYTSFLCVAINLVVIEFSFWEGFGDYFFYILVIFMFASQLVEIFFEAMLKEALLIGPLSAALGLMQGAASLGADDFQDFVIGYMIDYVLLVSGRLVMNEIIGQFVDILMNLNERVVVLVCDSLGRWSLVLELGVGARSARKSLSLSIYLYLSHLHARSPHFARLT